MKRISGPIIQTKHTVSLQEEEIFPDIQHGIKNVLHYHDKELEEVVSELTRCYRVTIVFDNEELKYCIDRGEHRNEPLENVLDTISYAFDMEQRIEGRKVVLSGQACRKQWHIRITNFYLTNETLTVEAFHPDQLHHFENGTEPMPLHRFRWDIYKEMWFAFNSLDDEWVNYGNN